MSEVSVGILGFLIAVILAVIGAFSTWMIEKNRVLRYLASAVAIVADQVQPTCLQ